MNICFITQEYPPETNWGGIATYTQTLARQMVKMGQRVHVITLTEKDEYITDDMGVIVHRIGRKPKDPFDPKNLSAPDHYILSFSRRVYEEILMVHKDEPIDIIEAPETCAQAFFAFKGLKDVKTVTRLHTPFFWIRH
ncbi:MAG: glycosyltransferase, partial [Deltaproteobacteria bacterium]|nr:glycosyltransferase [Deltaproteobacteria bacterium]